MNIAKIDLRESTPKNEIVGAVRRDLEEGGYTVVEENSEKPWGAYLRLANEDADAFVEQYFPGLTATDARLGNVDAELSPKILVVSPGERLSWQYHDRRAERWAFLTDGAYVKSETDEQPPAVLASEGDVVQFARGERHRLVGVIGHYTLVAEIWQHTDPHHPSNEDDIVRVDDDYSR